MAELTEALKFIEKIEKDNLGQSVYEIANQLRGYTKPQYTTKLWTLATGYNQNYIQGEFQGKLSLEVVLSGEKVDFGHFIASLSDQINQQGIRKSDLTSWTGDHTSWAGDIGSAIVFYRSQSDPTNKISLDEALRRLASDTDCSANVAAYVIGNLLNRDRKLTISQAIRQYDATSYAVHIQTFLSKRFGANISGNTLQNPDTVEAKMRLTVSTYIGLSSTASNVYKSVKNLVKLQPQLASENQNIPNASDLLTGSLHFLSHLVKFGGLESLNFQPYQVPSVSWLGKVDYFVNSQ
ncbi:hypothetical protein [Nostoc sp. CMAA1605]|uniref:hypothetical protein n=1 Tax=Nostoc sp. CMAA1605 TaxID=2055159 RepID=UPI001F305C47|nr:hypothetical protein [Nostoc sp. CMAA1605]MCF4966216.1 hypothetical protein [Nostoc sp. CMAA1605]